MKKIIKTILITISALLITALSVKGAQQTFHVVHIPGGVVAPDSMYIYDFPSGGSETGYWYIGSAKIDTNITVDDNTKKEVIVKNFGAGYPDSGQSTMYPLNNLNTPQATWTYGSGRTISSFGFSVTVGTNNDKTGYSISGTKTTLDDLNDFAYSAEKVTLVDSSASNVSEIDAVSTSIAALNDFDYSLEKVTLVDSSASNISEMDVVSAKVDTLGFLSGWTPGTTSYTYFTNDSDYILIVTPAGDTTFRFTYYHLADTTGGPPDSTKATVE